MEKATLDWMRRLAPEELQRKTTMPLGDLRRKDRRMHPHRFSRIIISMAFMGIILSFPSHERWPGTSHAWAGDPSGKTEERTPSPSLKAGEKIKIDEHHYFIYGFDKKPQMGTVVLKIQIFSSDGKRDTSYDITGDAGMSAMKGMHDSGEQPFKLNKKGDYLLPVDVVMPGDWEVRLTFTKDKKPVFSGRVNFDV